MSLKDLLNPQTQNRFSLGLSNYDQELNEAKQAQRINKNEENNLKLRDRLKDKIAKILTDNQNTLTP